MKTANPIWLKHAEGRTLVLSEPHTIFGIQSSESIYFNFEFKTICSGEWVVISPTFVLTKNIGDNLQRWGIEEEEDSLCRRFFAEINWRQSKQRLQK